MADLRARWGGRNGERGQLLLIAAFIIAVSFVVLALVVNSAIFTENLATRDDVAGSGEALDFRNEVSQNLGGTITEINQNNSLDTNLENLVENNVNRLDTQSGIQQSAQGRIVNVSFNSWQPGMKVAQDDTRGFTNESGKEDWTLVEDVEDTRNMKLNITDDTNIISLISASDPFRMVAEKSGGNEWELTIEKEEITGGNNITEVTVDPPGVSSETCRREFDEFLVIDVTRGTIGGEPCHALTRLTDGTAMWFATGVSDDYQIRFENGNRINGTYSFIVDDGASEFDSINFDSPGNGPYTKDAIYSASVSYSYYTPDIGYETVIRAVPGEVPS